jgi:hypothetical protein
LLAKCNTLELVEAIFFCGAVDYRILEKVSFDPMMIDGSLGAPFAHDLLDLPRVPLLVVDKARKIVALVQVLKDR